MTDNRGIIKKYGIILEGVVKNAETSSETKKIIKIAMEFGYTVRDCEARFEARNDPYTATRCIKRYEELKKLLEDKQNG